MHKHFASEEIVDRQIADDLIPPDLKEKIIFVLLRKHRHQTKKPIHRSLADIGKSSNMPSSERLHFHLQINKKSLEVLDHFQSYCFLCFLPS